MSDKPEPTMEDILAIFDARWAHMAEQQPRLPDYVQRISNLLLGRYVAHGSTEIGWLMIKAMLVGYIIRENGWPFLEDFWATDWEKLMKDVKDL